MSSILEVLTPYLGDRRVPEAFAAALNMTAEQREEYSSSAAALVEEVLMRAPVGSKNVEISHGESMMLRELFEQVIIDLRTVLDTEDIEDWRKKRVESLERMALMINSMVTVNILLMRR